MSLVSAISGDWKYIEGIETVEVLPQNDEGAKIPGVKALRQAMGGNPLVNATAGIDPSDVNWHLWSATMQAYEPKNGDIITAANDGTTWTIMAVGQSLRTGRFICTCRQRVNQ